MLSIFTLPYNQSPEIFHLTKLKLDPHFPSLQALAATLLLSVSMILTTLDTLHKWNHTTFVLLSLVYFTSIMSSRFIHVVACVRISFLSKAE